MGQKPASRLLQAPDFTHKRPIRAAVDPAQRNRHLSGTVVGAARALNPVPAKEKTMFIQTEATPNPATLKFLPGRPCSRPARSICRDRADAAQSPLAERLFDIPGVTGVFFGSDFIAVTKTDGEWQQIKPAMLGAIMEHYMSGAPCSRAGGDAAERDGDEFFDAGRRRDGRHHQGPDRDAGAAGGRRRRRRHHLQGLQGRRGLSAHEGRLLGLPVLDRDAQARHPELAPAFRARRGRSAAGICDASRSRLRTRGLPGHPDSWRLRYIERCDTGSPGLRG